MRLRYTTPAVADLASILDYVSSQSPQGATRIKARVQTVLGLLLRYPLLGVRTADPRVRRMGAIPYPYMIFYEVGDDEIIVHAIRHAFRDPDTMPGSV